jgi:hypothetical protein
MVINCCVELGDGRYDTGRVAAVAAVARCKPSAGEVEQGGDNAA